MKFILSLIYYFLYAISLLVFIRALSSFFGNARNSKYYGVLYRLTEPFLAPLRTLMARLFSGRPMMFDFSYIALYLIVMVLQRIILIIQASL